MVSVTACVTGPAVADVCFYEHANFQGRSFCAPLGAQQWSLASHGWNDIISSIQLGSGGSVEVCEHEGFGGACQTLTSNSAYVGDWWNDRISSFRATADSGWDTSQWSHGGDGSFRAGDGEVCFFEHADYQGRSFCERRGERQWSLARTGWNDIISSIQVGPGVSIEVCEHEGFGGRCMTYDSSTSFVGDDWNDIISSFAVR
jgi:hypothetical protein